jgi:hypothetical protein
LNLKRVVAISLLMATMLFTSPAHARYGTGWVDTWLTKDGSSIGRRVDAGAMTVRLLHPYAQKRVRWVIAARGGQSGTYHLTFQGCATGGGVGFRYFLPSGKEVTAKVIDDGYTFSVHHRGDRRSLIVQATWRGKRVERTCELDATGNTGSDDVRLRVITN